MRQSRSLKGKRLLVVTTMCFVLLGLGHAGALGAWAQDATPSPSPSATPDEEKRRIELETAEALLQKTRAEAKKIEADTAKTEADTAKALTDANKAAQDLAYPDPTSSPLEGKTTIEGAVIESQMISYASVARAANRIIDSIKGYSESQRIKNLAIYNERDINLLLSYKTGKNQVDIIRQGYCRLLTTAVTGERCPAGVDVGAKGRSILPLQIAQSFLGAFVDMTSLLRTNVEIKGQTFVVDEGPLVAEVFRAARRPSGFGLPGTVRLFYPHVFPPNINPNSGSPMLAELERLRELRVAAEKLVTDVAETQKKITEGEANIKQLTGQIEGLPRRIGDSVLVAGNLIKAHCPALVGDVDTILALPQKPTQAAPMLLLIDSVVAGACPAMTVERREVLLSLRATISDQKNSFEKATADLPKAQAEQEKLEDQLEALKGKLSPKSDAGDALAQLKALNAQFDNFVKVMTQVDAATGSNPLTNFIRTESLLSALPAEGSYWLQLKVINAGGNNRVKTNLIVDIFTGGNRVSHSGGAIVLYHLFDSNGRSVASDSIADYTNYIKADKVRDLTNSKPDKRRPASSAVDDTHP